MSQLDYYALSPEEAANLIGEAIDIIETVKKVNQTAVGLEIGFDGLSKARNIKKYRYKDPYSVRGRDRRNILRLLVEQYGLVYEPATHSFRFEKGLAKTATGNWYIYYYYIDRLRMVNRGMVCFESTKRVKLFVLNPKNPGISYDWAGTYERKGTYLFLTLTDSGTKSFASMHTYFAGGLAGWQPLYVGTFSGIRNDGSPLVGKSVLELTSNRESAMQKIMAEPVPPEIFATVKDGTVMSNQILPRNYSELLPKIIWDYMLGDFQIAIERESIILGGTLSFDICQNAKLSLEDGREYLGSFLGSLINEQYLEVRLKETRNGTFMRDSSVFFQFHIPQLLKKDIQIFSGVVLAKNKFALPKASPVLIYREEVFSNPERKTRIIGAYFEKYLGGSIRARDQWEMRKLLQEG